ncbi:Putative NADH-flavin reductase [Parapedobacter composti]|uniref:Putative NADH-flavin reductase n=1 Tax=Parapedobacter composti TaxID=623281 RepID=A0A1I1F119_9SPHI|nr:SDR family oxidoreductase [Parapedobacter composti]SFB93095.1 Putative NADH-flavin reductase [Parapedobacter composti]
MKIVIFGSTGSIGMHLVQQALQQGHAVTAFTRNPVKLSPLNHAGLTVVQGDILNYPDVEQAVRQQDAVLCAIGDGNKGKVRAAGTRNIIAAMKKMGVNRLICQTTLGLGESWGNLNFFWRHIMFGFLLRKAFHDHEVQEKQLMESGLDYTIVRPSAFTDGRVTRSYNVGFDGDHKPLTLKISRADVADFMLQQLHRAEYVKKAVSISN